MGHHFVQEKQGHHLLTMAYVGYTAIVKYPVIQLLSEEKLDILIRLLEHSSGDILHRLCYDLLKAESYEAYDGGIVDKDTVDLNPVEMHGSKGTHAIPSKFKQGAEHSERTLAAFEGDTVQQISIFSSIELYIVYTNAQMDTCVGMIRTPFAGLRDLGNECRVEQGIRTFVN
ncbi:MAG: hypothetical protein KTR29_21975 [Rhodothermaceae bacterium]|nr:hypothetical protein [Rhodothermaceae bacterium]